jgi:hypothetical protein
VTLTITPDQRRDIDQARQFLVAAAADDRNVLAAYVGEDSDREPGFYASALGVARVRLANLLAVVDSLASAQHPAETLGETYAAEFGRGPQAAPSDLDDDPG